MLAVVQAVAILYSWKTAPLEVPLLRNPSLAGTFVALTLFESPWLFLAAPAVAFTTRHIPIVVLLLCVGWRYAQRKA